MTTIKIFKQSKILSTLQIVILSTLLIASFSQFIENLKFGGSLFGYISFPLFLIATSVAFYHLYFTKYFISWNEEKLYYKFPKETEITQINLNSIKSVEVKLFEIQLILDNNSEKILEFHSIEDQELSIIKNKFKEIKQNIDITISEVALP